MRIITPTLIHRELGQEIADIKTQLKHIRLEPQNIDRDERLERLERRLSMKLHLKTIIQEHLL